MEGIIKKSQFRKDLETAKEQNRDRFMHNGQVYLVEYAHYLVEYMAILEESRKQHLSGT